jgi:hypothetical protein
MNFLIINYYLTLILKNKIKILIIKIIFP